MVYSEGNIFSILVFFLWVPIALWIARRCPPAKAASLLFLLPLMLLPERVEFNLPGLPKLEKAELAIIWLLIGVLLFHREQLRAVKLNRWTKVSVFLLLMGNVATVFLNADPLSYGPRYIFGHDPYDAVHAIGISLLNYVLPLVLAAAMFNGSKDARVFFRVFLGAAAVYGVFQLIEVRLSPQLHSWVYGFFQHTFRQMIREGGYRPIVFMRHALTVAMFTLAGLLTAATLYKTKGKVFRVSAAWLLAFLWLVAFLNKSVAAFLYSLVAVPLILFFSPKTQFRVAMLLAIIVLGYPALRGGGFIPVEGLREFAAVQFGAQRESSLMTRFENEEALFERASERSFFGWGTYCRACIFDPHSGKKESIADGDWIITLGQFGFVGFLGKYLLMLLPIFLAARRMKYLPSLSDRRLLSGLALIVGFSAFDLLPNGNYNYLPFVFSGVLAGCSTGMVREAAWRKRLKRQQAAARKPDPSQLAELA